MLTNFLPVTPEGKILKFSQASSIHDFTAVIRMTHREYREFRKLYRLLFPDGSEEFLSAMMKRSYVSTDKETGTEYHVMYFFENISGNSGSFVRRYGGVFDAVIKYFARITNLLEGRIAAGDPAFKTKKYLDGIELYEGLDMEMFMANLVLENLLRNQKKHTAQAGRA